MCKLIAGAQSILRRGAYVSCRGYAGIPQAHSVIAVNQGGTADKYLFVLDRRVYFCRGRFCFRQKNTILGGDNMFLLVKRWRGSDDFKTDYNYIFYLTEESDHDTQ